MPVLNMKWVKSFQKFRESVVIDLSVMSAMFDLNESLTMWYDLILNSIGAEEINMFDTFHLPKEEYQSNMDIDYLSNDTEFINSLSSIGLKKSQIQNTDDIESFINKSCRFMMIYNIESNELENPIYIIFQIWNETLNKWEDAKLYKVNDDIKKFYDKLSSKTIELNDDLNIYVYTTSNGNEWILQNLEKQNDDFKKYLRKVDLENLVKDKKLKITII